MKFVYPEIDHIFDTDTERIPVLVIENQELLLRLLSDVQSQIDGKDGRCVVSAGGKVLPFGKMVELHSQFVPFDINKKSILTKAVAEMEDIAVTDHYEQVAEILTNMEKLLVELSFEMSGEIVSTKLSWTNLLKSVGMEFVEEYSTLAEKLLDYMELVQAYERQKLFIFVNLRSYVNDSDMEMLMETILKRRSHVLFIESHELRKLPCEQRYVVDIDLCEIG
ncbi:MAG: type II-A CRISPR-associated protein Csn2 [Lachnospiraceae bacterium]|nr:type II-A CRISPR-associated protein Csn2 [Lachnospiraceae bacterium]